MFFVAVLTLPVHVMLHKCISWWGIAAQGQLAGTAASSLPCRAGICRKLRAGPAIWKFPPVSPQLQPPARGGKAAEAGPGPGAPSPGPGPFLAPFPDPRPTAPRSPAVPGLAAAGRERGEARAAAPPARGGFYKNGSEPRGRAVRPRSSPAPQERPVAETNQHPAQAIMMMMMLTGGGGNK